MSEKTTDGDGASKRATGSTLLPRFIGRSFVAKFLLALVVVLVLVGSVSAYTFTQTSQELSDETETEYTGIAQQGAFQLDTWQNERGDTTIRLANLADMESGEPQTVQERIDEEMKRLPEDVANLYYIDLSANGEVLATSSDAFQPDFSNENPDFDTLSTDNAPWVTLSIDNLELGDDNLFISDPVRANQRSNIYFVSEVQTDDNRDIVLAMQTDIDTLAGDLGTNARDQFTVVVNDQGKIIADSRPSEETTLAAGTSSFPDYIDGQSGFPSFVDAERQSGFAESVTEGGQLEEPHVAGWAKVANSDLVVITKEPTSQAFSLRSTVTNSLLVLVGTVLLGFLVVGFVFGRGTVSALSRLTGKANELASGNLDVDLSVERADEFGTLTASFAAMRDSLKERIEEAEQARKEAEVSRAEAMELNSYLQDRADEYARIMQQCATGDLTQRMDPDGENEAMDRIATEFNEMIDELEQTTGQLKSFAEEVETAGRDVQQSADVVRETSEDAVDAALTVSNQADDQKQRLQDIAGALDQVVADLDDLDATHENVNLDDALDRLEDTATLIGEVLTETDVVLNEAEDAATAAEEQAAELNEVSERAGDLVRYAGPLQEVLDRFQTESERKFYFPTGPGSSDAQPSDE
ncbi:PDC sensor domain-containing protein [Halapricum desulfuricans]|uniref:Methyl-accepting chemotaxis protein n=1 Tax=Halapricum desulfuricans TaxID=2841257 RepID=A0A897NIY0_9EURY|nr:methyl-accepting chemotaxis protein [Halapricum desulfuricans]QSG10256.1 Methyl-accepting chemotaxis protein [Halapricum desulfuricans]